MCSTISKSNHLPEFQNFGAATPENSGGLDQRLVGVTGADPIKAII
jgi:hypothetical protein